MSEIARRNLLKAIPLTAVGMAMATRQGAAQENAGSENILVAYFSRTGNTRVIAQQIRRARNANLFEIKAATPYPEDYEETVAQAARETRSGYLPALAAFVAHPSRYETIYLGFPIWGMTAPPIIRSFLRAHDFSGKALHPFITHGGYGLGNSVDIVKDFSAGAQIKEPFVMEADQERRTLQQVNGWLSS